MSVKLPQLNLLLFLLVWYADSEDADFTYNGFRGSNLSLEGLAQITSNGLLMITNRTAQQSGHAFYPYPLNFKNLSDGKVFSFSTTLVFAIFSQPGYPDIGGHGLAFAMAPSRGFPGSQPDQYLGIFNKSNNGKSSNHIVAVELDTLRNIELADVDDNHVGIDVNSLTSVASAPASYFTDQNGGHKNLTLKSGKAMQLWIEYNGVNTQINVTLAPINVPKPDIPLLSFVYDLSSILEDHMYVGFSASNSPALTPQYVLGWSFKMNGPAKELTLSQLPKLPRVGPKQISKFVTVGLPIIGLVLSCTVFAGILFILRKRKFAEVLEDWELDYGPHRFKFKDLYIATKGFREKELLGTGGFGMVYRGILPTSKVEVAVKRVSHESRQGMTEFVAEIASIGRLRHRNLVQLLGYCRRKGELLLVYDYMPNGSLDKYLFDQPKSRLSWDLRFQVIKGVASALFYLHEDWEQIVVHRDVKSSNVLLDREFNGKLGDFGLSRLYDHGTDPQTTHVMGTLGYLAPEITRTSKPTPSTDVFAFGAFMLEVACGKRPIEPQASGEDVILVDWVISFWSRGTILETADPKLRGDYVVEEMDLVLKLGLLCCNSCPTARPTMRQILEFLKGEAPLPDPLSVSASSLAFAHSEGFSDFSMPYSSPGNTTTQSSVAESLLSTGRW
ncbi:PREDICTED: L-type lectin-domain containing receptor kinase IV.1-like [Nelumbo nucifera]|nr:PREDICTED: L-type lectin-domain containing receptor kinase IV.1-like [Nelumbo nucifera]